MNEKIAVIIIAYNNYEFIIKQAQCISMFLKDDYDLIIVDNSSDSEKSAGILHHSKELGCIYVKTNASSFSSSESHAFAANFSYNKHKDGYRYFMFLDHDCFLIKPFSVIETLPYQEKAIGGIGQGKLKTYLWPGCLIFDKFQTGDVDFSVNSEFGLDTGGNLYKILEKLSSEFSNKELVIHFNEVYTQNPDFNVSFYNFYTLIFNNTFMHFLNGSNWNHIDDNERRINSLFNILQNKIDENSSSSLPQ